MKFGLCFTNQLKQIDWMREADQSISFWTTQEEAERWRKNNTVFPNKYTVKKLTKKIFESEKNTE